MLTLKVGDQEQRISPVLWLLEHAGCGPDCELPETRARAPAPPYQPSRYSVQFTEQPLALRTMRLTRSPALALTRSAYASICLAQALVKPVFQPGSPVRWFSPGIGFT